LVGWFYHISHVFHTISFVHSQPDAGDYSYSGMHDHGTLPKLKEGGEFSRMIGLVNEARKHSDELLTRIIKEEQTKGRKHNSGDVDDVQGKKARVNDE
jgi:hypothetical protein